jgi:hypothetical protein
LAERPLSKPKTAAGYSAGQLKAVRATCLSLASILGDLLDDLVVVGGLVPSLLIDNAASRKEPHLGSLDVDVGLEVAMLDTGRYHTFAERLRGRDFEPDKNEQGNPTRQRWTHKKFKNVKVDFLMAPVGTAAAGTLQDLEADLAAVVTPGLPLAFRDRERIRLADRTLEDEAITRDIPVCGAGALLVLKALAFRNRGENKDAYDLWYLLATSGIRSRTRLRGCGHCWTTRMRGRPCVCSERTSRRSIPTGHAARRSSCLDRATMRSAPTSPVSCAVC